MNTLDVISYALLAMITIKFVDDVIRAEPSSHGKSETTPPPLGGKIYRGNALRSPLEWQRKGGEPFAPRRRS